MSRLSLDPASWQAAMAVPAVTPPVTPPWVKSLTPLVSFISLIFPSSSVVYSPAQGLHRNLPDGVLAQVPRHVHKVVAPVREFPFAHRPVLADEKPLLPRQ